MLTQTPNYLLGWVITLLLLSSGSANSQTAGEMLSKCDGFRYARSLGEGKFTFPPGEDAHQCWGAFLTFRQLVDLAFIGDTNPRLGLCPPQAVGALQMVRVFISYADQHPEKHHIPFAWFAWESLAKSFSCTPLTK